MNLCEICPRKCKVDRSIKNGICGANDIIKVSKVMLHMWEEPIISSGTGSGAIFFSNCSLKCIYCQNYKISSGGLGREITVNNLVEIFKKLEKLGANNINLVSPTHYTKQIIEALNIYRPKIPIVWNTSGYETVENNEILKNYVDIYLSDLKYFSSELSKEFSLAADYFENASKSILKMRENQPQDIIENGIMRKGLIVRHLVLPKCFEDSKKILNFIAENLGRDTYISLMSQYTPCFKAREHEILKNKLNKIEYKIVLNEMKKLGFVNGFYQDYSSASSDFTPDFEKKSEIDF